MLELLVFGGVIFWIIVAFATISSIALLENERPGWAFVIVAVVLGVWHKPIFGALSWQAIAVASCAYLFIGTSWSLYKWTCRVKKVLIERPDEVDKDTEGNIYASRELKKELSPSRNKGMLMGWIMLWPFSLSWSLTGDLVNTMYNFLGSAYERMTKRMISRTVDNIIVKRSNTATNTANSYRTRGSLLRLP